MCVLCVLFVFLMTQFYIVSNKWMVTHWQVVVLISPILSLGVLVWYFLKMLLYPSKKSSVVVSIPACHAGDPGSIPGLGDFLFVAEEVVMC